MAANYPANIQLNHLLPRHRRARRPLPRFRSPRLSWWACVGCAPSGAVHIDAKWGHFGADHWVEGRPTEEGQGAALDFSVARRKPELFIAGECLAEGPRQTLQTMLHEAVHALAHVRGVKDTSRGGKYHNKREVVLDPRQAVHPRADHLRDLRPGLPTPGRRQQQGR
jgi:hypothetical protein